MWRHQAICKHCGVASHWHGDREQSEAGMVSHMHQAHEISSPRAPDYKMVAQRQCDWCLEEFVDSCTKCEKDFCRLHSGVIDGLCSCCI